jgi:formiminotetrahydrofolate cyclodeaminase
MYIEGSIKAYLDDLASNKPAPGGGSGAAFMGGAGSALLGMVSNFTVGKKKYKDVEGEILALLEKTERIRSEMMRLVDDDVKGYDVVTAAYAMPKKTDEEKKARSAAIQNSMKKALEVPLEICKLAHEGLGTCADLLAKGNKNLVSDVGVGALGLWAAYKGGLLNVEINLSYLKDEAFVAEHRAIIGPMTEEVEKLASEAFLGTLRTIKG